jgi:hypothetical protein
VGKTGITAQAYWEAKNLSNEAQFVLSERWEQVYELAPQIPSIQSLYSGSKAKLVFRTPFLAVAAEFAELISDTTACICFQEINCYGQEVHHMSRDGRTWLLPSGKQD